MGVLVTASAFLGWQKVNGWQVVGYGQYALILLGVAYFGLNSFAIMNSSGHYQGPEVFKFLTFIVALVGIIFSFGTFLVVLLAMWYFNR
jgi:hypothetical protein